MDIFLCFELNKNAKTLLTEQGVQLLLVAVHTRSPIEISQATLSIPSVKCCVKYRMLEEVDQQCKDLCVRKHGSPGPSVLCSKFC